MLHRVTRRVAGEIPAENEIVSPGRGIRVYYRKSISNEISSRGSVAVVCSGTGGGASEGPTVLQSSQIIEDRRDPLLGGLGQRLPVHYRSGLCGGRFSGPLAQTVGRRRVAHVFHPAGRSSCNPVQRSSWRRRI